MHSLRVETYVLKILAREQHALDAEDIFLLRLAAILHDVSRMEVTPSHAELGAQIARAWLQDRTADGLTAAQIDRVVTMIAGHSSKDIPGPDFSQAVLKDADTLDEIGVMSIFMAGNWLDPHSALYFHQLRQRLVEFELPYCDKQMVRLNTQGARTILTEKKTFIEQFIAQLTDELDSEAVEGL